MGQLIVCTKNAVLKSPVEFAVSFSNLDITSVSLFSSFYMCFVWWANHVYSTEYGWANFSNFPSLNFDSIKLYTNSGFCFCLRQRGERMTKAEVKAILDEADDNGDGRLDYSEVDNW